MGVGSRSLVHRQDEPAGPQRLQSQMFTSQAPVAPEMCFSYCFRFREYGPTRYAEVTCALDRLL